MACNKWTWRHLYFSKQNMKNKPLLCNIIRNVLVKVCHTSPDAVKRAKYNKKFWEELIAYFPSYNTSHTEKDASNIYSIVVCVFVTAVTFLPSRCLATIGGFLPGRCLATLREFLPSRCLATIGGIHRHTHPESNVIS
jgi:hypothetical protein